MKKLLLILLCLPMIGFGQFTYVPDDNFENALINLGLDNVLDDSVATSAIDTVTNLDIESLNISDLTGIEGFISLIFLHCGDNQLTTLNVSSNTHLLRLDCNDNQIISLNLNNNLVSLFAFRNNITTLDLSQLSLLQNLYCESNQLSSLDVSNNPALRLFGCGDNLLTSLNLCNNPALLTLWAYANLFTSLDLSNNPQLEYFQCQHNPSLSSLDLRNGNNSNITLGLWNFNLSNNPNLTCINVDDSTYSTNNWTVSAGYIDTQHYFSNNCSGGSIYGCTDCQACNYDVFATIDNNSCSYAVSGVSSDTACDSYTWEGQTITSSQVLTHTYIGGTTGACDSIHTLNLIINNSTSSYDTLSVSASIVWNGIPLNVSGDYSVTLINSVGCDSIANLNLTVTSTGIYDIANNKSNLVKIADMLGQETPFRKNTPLFYIYDDGTVEKRIVIE